MKPASQPWPLWTGLLAFAILLILYGLTSKPRSKQSLAQIQPTGTATLAANFTPTPSKTPQPQLITSDSTLPAPTFPAYVPVSGTDTPTSTVLPPLSTPYTGAQAYRIKTWTEQDALQALDQARTVNFTEDYAFDQGFYEESLLYEEFLRFPELRSDSILNDELIQLKGTQGLRQGYAFVHDSSIEPLRSQLEIALDNSQVNLSPDSLQAWMEAKQLRVIDQSSPLNSLFGDSTPALVIQVGSSLGNYSIFVIKQTHSNSYSVLSLFPNWVFTPWGKQIYQFRDLNGNGQSEIGVTTYHWGTGMSQFCDIQFQDFEWDGHAFQDLMGAPGKIDIPTEDCTDLTFTPADDGTQSIGFWFKIPTTACADQFYIEETSYRWDGQSFKKTQTQAMPPEDKRLDECAISWAETAGPNNKQAVQILSDALAHWPVMANLEWGSASQDYFSLKLASWYLQLGQLDQGLAILHTIATTPHAPAYSMATQVANSFLKAYASGGMYRAVQAADDFYWQKLDMLDTCQAGCNLDEIRLQWGFIDSAWDGGDDYLSAFRDDFENIDSISLSLQADHPKDLVGLIQWFNSSQINYRELRQADLDGDGLTDWLVDIPISGGNVSNLYALLITGHFNK